MTENYASKIVFENNEWTEFHSFLREYSYSQYFVLVDKNTEKFCLKLVDEQMENAGLPYQLLRVEAGENSKDISVCINLWNQLTVSNADRKSLLINLGGGMITDLGGFVAATYKRGIDFLNLPTSLLAMVDASSGGKCGVDFNHYKNQIGVFKEAIKTIIYPPFLSTLNMKEIKSGFAEAIKHALISNEDYFKELTEMVDIAAQLDQEILQKSVEIKAQIVSIDPFEQNERKKLNFGHTIGHAIESYFYEKGEPIPHGYAVAAGIVCESYLSMRKLNLAENEHKELELLILRHYGQLPIGNDQITPILKYIAQDKKNEKGKTQFTLLEKIGTASINHTIEIELVKESLEFYSQLK